ncbi:AMP-dependent synthetase [Escherichia coli]|nr:AMP-dependent synthetase [Escherichia coli]EFU9531018.1 AMP-dependent synthetase [Escherichia coli]
MSGIRSLPMIKLLTGLLLLVWPFLIWLGLVHNSLHWLLPLMALLLLLRLRQPRRQTGLLQVVTKIVAVVGIVLCVSSFLLKTYQLLLFYPVVVNAVMLAVFGGSLRSTMPIVERLARLQEPDLPEKAVRYTRRVTQVWCLFFIFNGRIAFDDIASDAFIELFTSGSTGQPKQIAKPLISLDQEANMLATHFADRLLGCRFVASVMPQHLYGLTFRIFLPMALGLPLHAAMLWYSEQLAALSHTYRYAFVSSPAFLKRLDLHLTPPPVEMILSAGGMLPWQDVEKTSTWLNIWPDEIYGSTETGILAWRYRQQDNIPWFTFSDVHLSQESEGVRVFSPLIPAEGLVLDDMLQFNENGQFHLIGRRGRVVKIEEKRISLVEIEQRLLALDGIMDVAAIPLIRNGRQAIGVVVVPNKEARQIWQCSGGKTLELSWRKALLPWLEPVAVPRYWRIIDEIPVNNMNKRVYAQLQELFHDTP